VESEDRREGGGGGGYKGSDGRKKISTQSEF